METAMNEKELIKKLKAVKFAGIELYSHRRRLKAALFKAGNQKKVQEKPDVIKGGLKVMQKLILSRQPVWKMIIGGVAVIVLTLALSLGISLGGESPDVRAATIALNSPEVKAAMYGANATALTVVTFWDPQKNEDCVVLVQKGGAVLPVPVDLKDQKVIDFNHPSFAPEETQEALSIAMADERIFPLLDQGLVVELEFGFGGVKVAGVDFDKYGLIKLTTDKGHGGATVNLKTKKVIDFWYEPYAEETPVK
jgi:hypothetical protein